MLRIDLGHCGIPSRELSRQRAPLRAALAELDRSPHAGFLRVIHRAGLARQVARFARERAGTYSDVVQLGIGGSSLGAQALCAALLASDHNTATGRSAPRYHFPDNVDPESFGALLERLDPRRTLVHVVSKSGGTLETQAQLYALLEHFRRRVPAYRLDRHVVATTGSGGPLRELADREGLATLSFPEDVPGRFSVFTASGLLVPALCGVPVGRVLGGARRMEAACRSDPLAGPAGRLAAAYALHDLQRGRPIHVELIYADALLKLGEWFRQIWAESLGKGGRGPTPVVARGTTDQHSQIQLYVEGPDDKLYTFVRTRRYRRRTPVSRAAYPPEVAGRDLAAVFDAEALGTREALLEAGRPVIDIELPGIRPDAVGELLLMQQLQTALAGSLYECDPFTQPGVDAGKRAALRLLGASGGARTRRTRPAARSSR